MKVESISVGSPSFTLFPMFPTESTTERMSDVGAPLNTLFPKKSKSGGGALSYFTLFPMSPREITTEPTTTFKIIRTTEEDLIEFNDNSNFLPLERSMNNVNVRLCKPGCHALRGYCFKKTTKFFRFFRYIKSWATKGDEAKLVHLNLLC